LYGDEDTAGGLEGVVILLELKFGLNIEVNIFYIKGRI